MKKLILLICLLLCSCGKKQPEYLTYYNVLWEYDDKEYHINYYEYEIGSTIPTKILEWNIPKDKLEMDANGGHNKNLNCFYVYLNKVHYKLILYIFDSEM